MKEYTFVGTFDTAKLHDELWASYPNWRIEVGVQVTDLISLDYSGSVLHLYLPDEADDIAVQGIIDTHDPGTYLALTYDEVQNLRRNFMNLPQVPFWTVDDGREWVHLNVLSGMGKEEAAAWIDQVPTQEALKTLAGAVIDIRGVLEIIIQAIIYLRDIVIKYRAA